MTQILFLGEWRDVLEGTCRTCGQPLVQIKGARTYHPVESFKEMCGALIPLAIEGSFSVDVEDIQFIPKESTLWINVGRPSVARNALYEIREVLERTHIALSGKTALWLADKIVQVENGEANGDIHGIH